MWIAVCLGVMLLVTGHMLVKTKQQLDILTKQLQCMEVRVDGIDDRLYSLIKINESDGWETK